MRKAVGGLALILLFGIALSQARAQSSIVSRIAGDGAATDELHFGLRVGLSCSKLRGVTGAPESERLGGPAVGLLAVVRLSDRLSLAPEAVPFVRRGVTNIPFSPTGDPEIDSLFDAPERSALVLRFVDVPVLLRFKPHQRWHIGAGPYAGFLLTAKERFRSEPVEGQSLTFSRDVEGLYRGMDFGFVFEAAWTVARPGGGEGLVFHVRYQGGLTDLRKGPSAGPAVRTSAIHVFVSFPFIR